MANLILRPIDDGDKGDWQGTPSTTLWDNIADHDPDGDGSYVYTSTPGAFTCLLSDTSSGNFPRPARIRGITVVATVRSTLVFPDCRFRFRMNYYGVDYDTEEIFATDYVTYKEFYNTYLTAPNGDAFSNEGLKQMQLGLVYVDGPDIRCTKLEVQVHHELYPNVVFDVDGNGTDQQWEQNPDTNPAYMNVQGPYDGNLSYIFTDQAADRSTFEMQDMPPLLTTPIKKVSVSALVKSYGDPGAQGHVILTSGGTPYKGATSDLPLRLDDDSKWHIWEQTFLNDPNTGWPSGDPAATPWTPAEFNAIEVGVELDAESVRCTSLMTEVWLADIPLTEIDILPDGDGDLTDLVTLNPNAGEDPWEDIDEAVPDDATTYIGGDAAAFKRAVFGTFTVPAAAAIPAGERINNVELRYRMRLGASSSTVVAALIRDSGNQDTYISEPQVVEGTGTTWFDLVVDVARDPFTGLPWASSTDVTDYQYGFVVFEGEGWLSRMRVQIQTTLDIRAASDPTDLQLTTAALNLMTRSLTDGTVFAPTEFAVGSGGYDPTAPATVLPVNPADTLLMAEVFRDRILDARVDADRLSGKVTVAPGSTAVDGVGTRFTEEVTATQFINIAGEVHEVSVVTDDLQITLATPHVAGAVLSPSWISPMTVDYFCRVPREVAMEGIGEIGLWATIFQSPFPGEIGTKFLYALQHTPCQCLHKDAVQLYKVRVEFP